MVLASLIKVRDYLMIMTDFKITAWSLLTFVFFYLYYNVYVPHFVKTEHSTSRIYAQNPQTKQCKSFVVCLHLCDSSWKMHSSQRSTAVHKSQKFKYIVSTAEGGLSYHKTKAFFPRVLFFQSHHSNSVRTCFHVFWECNFCIRRFFFSTKVVVLIILECLDEGKNQEHVSFICKLHLYLMTY